MRFLRILLILIAVFITANARAENFYIDDYDINLKVLQNRTVQVKEAIRVVFTRPSHGIIRSIPQRKSHIYDVAVNEPFTTYHNGDLNIKIGDAERLVSGVKSYLIEYTQQIYDYKPEFYYNLIGTDWGVPIEHVRFQVQMPADVDASKVGLSIGRYGVRGFDGGAEYAVNGSYIWGQTHRVLQPNEGITMRIEVPEGYFDTTDDNKIEKLIWTWLSVLTAVSFFIWYLLGKDEHVTPVVTFHAPAEISPADAELIMTEDVTNKGLVAMIVKLADDGYFKINSDKKKFVLSDFQPYTGDNAIERELLLALQEAGNDGKVSDSDLKNSTEFFTSWEHLICRAGDKPIKRRYYERISLNFLLKVVMWLLMLGTLLLTLFPMTDYQASDKAMPCAMAIMFPYFLIYGLQSKTTLGQKLYGIIFIILFFTPAFFIFLQDFHKENLSLIVFGFCCFVITSTCCREMAKPNVKGRLLKGKLLGLKKFIEVAEKDRLEKMAEENPQYFYKILPYAYVLGVSDTWIKQFEGIAVPPPTWATDQTFNINNFNNLTNSFQSAVLPTTANGGISTSSGGGGGFSGGGFGGGGGSSW